MFTQKPLLKLEFSEKPILFKEFAEYNVEKKYPVNGKIKKYWDARKPSDINLLAGALASSNKTTCFSMALMHLDKVLFTLLRNDRTVCYHECRMLTDTEFLKGCTFPSDYNFLNVNKTYLMGMSAPPVMTAQIATEIYNQWISKL